ncbi:MAG TPA: hypothetical protein VGD80_09175 [Kofleriaceae bacterium]
MTDVDCGADGVCELGLGQLCSFPDTSCASGRRFDNMSGGMSGQCVEEPLGTDAGPDADATPPVMIDALSCFGTDIVQVCLASPPSQVLAITVPRTVDTSNAAACTVMVSGGDYCVLAGTDVTISARLQAIGSRPLVLIASGSITTTSTGLIDVGSHRISQSISDVGAGADPVSCATGTLPGAAGGGGGAGGSFLGLGGNGGAGGGGGSGGAPGAAVSAVSALRGGCPGQDGQGATGLAGHGGGAVYLIAGARIDVQGGINAAGEGGRGGAVDVGGGAGGGAGGMIGFDAPVITASSLLLASGGGGGGGAGSGGVGIQGDNAPDPSTTAAGSGGRGFVGNNTFGGNGGVGSVSMSRAPGAQGAAGDTGGQNHGGGGGGGGGAGLIKAPATADLGTNVSPPPTP